MYNEYPDLIYEGLISDSFYTDIVEEGLGESIKSGFNKLRAFANKFIEKVMEKLRQLMFNIKKFFNRFKKKSEEVKKEEISQTDENEESQSNVEDNNNENNEDIEDLSNEEEKEPEEEQKPKKVKEEPKVKMAVFRHKYDIDAESTEKFMDEQLMTFLLIEKQLKDIYEALKKSDPSSYNDHTLLKKVSFDEKKDAFYKTIRDRRAKFNKLFNDSEFNIDNSEIIRKYVTEDYGIIDHKDIDVEDSEIDAMVLEYSKITQNTLDKCQKALDTLKSCNTSINNIMNNLNKLVNKQREIYKRKHGRDSGFRKGFSSIMTDYTKEAIQYLNRVSSLFTEIVACVNTEMCSIKIVRKK